MAAPEEGDSAPATPVVKILDFGLARLTEDATEDGTLTHEGVIRGTVAYMSPEQARGDVAAIDVRSDVYSLGVILYEMLAGRRPHDTSKVSLIDAARLVATTPVPRLAEAWPGTKALDRDLETIVGKALELEPDRRYAGAGDLAGDVARYLGSLPIVARPTSRAYRMRMFARRHRAGVAAAGAIAVALLAGIAGTTAGLVSALRSSRLAAARTAELEKVVAFQSAQLSGVDATQMGLGSREDLTADLRTALAQSHAPAAEADGTLAQFAAALSRTNAASVALHTLDRSIFARTLKAIDSQFKDQPLVKARLLQVVAEVLWNVGLRTRPTRRSGRRSRSAAPGSARMRPTRFSRSPSRSNSSRPTPGTRRPRRRPDPPSSAPGGCSDRTTGPPSTSSTALPRHHVRGAPCRGGAAVPGAPRPRAALGRPRPRGHDRGVRRPRLRPAAGRAPRGRGPDRAREHGALPARPRPRQPVHADLDQHARLHADEPEEVRRGRAAVPRVARGAPPRARARPPRHADPRREHRRAVRRAEALAGGGAVRPRGLRGFRAHARARPRVFDPARFQPRDRDRDRALDEAERLQRESWERARRVAGLTSHFCVRSLLEWASEQRQRHRAAEAEAPLAELEAALRADPKSDPANRANALTRLGEIRLDLGRHAAAEAALLESDRLRPEAQKKSKWATETVSALADVYDAWEKAEPRRGHAAQAARWKAQAGG